MLSIKEPVFRSIEESVRSIVPTNLSLCSDDATSIRSFESSELCYAPFSFENELFTSYVYKRNFRVTRLHIKQVQRTPTVKSSHAVVATDAAQSYYMSAITEASKSNKLAIHRTCASDSAQPINVMGDIESIGHLSMNGDALEDSRSLLSSAEVIVDNHTPDLISVEGEIEAQSALLITRADACIADVSSDTGHVQIMPAAIGIEHMSASSSTHSKRIPTCQQHLLHTLNKSSLEQQAAAYGSQISHEDQPNFLERCIKISSQLQQGVSETPGDLILDRMLHLPAHTVASLEMTLALKVLHDRERSFFGTFMQVLGLMRGTRFMAQFTDALALSYNRIVELDEIPPIDGGVVQSNWTSIILNDPGIAHAASFRDLATSTGLLNYTPTVLQLACVAKKALVVEYLLSLGRPLVPLDWKVHPFILATKRRCKPILELFLKLSKGSVSQLIKNIALAMVVNQDCALSGDWLEADRNDNRRVSEDVGIITFLLANGASPNGKDENNTSVLSMAIRAACSLNPFSLQIVDILLRRGAQFGRREQELMSAGPVEAFEGLLRRHRLMLGRPVKQNPPMLEMIQSNRSPRMVLGGALG